MHGAALEYPVNTLAFLLHVFSEGCGKGACVGGLLGGRWWLLQDFIWLIDLKAFKIIQADFAFTSFMFLYCVVFMNVRI